MFHNSMNTGQIPHSRCTQSLVLYSQLYSHLLSSSTSTINHSNNPAGASFDTSGTYFLCSITSYKLMTMLPIGPNHSGGRGRHHPKTSSHDPIYKCHKCERKTSKCSGASGEPKYCEAHQCGIIDIYGRLCSKRKDRENVYCSRHLCQTSGCEAQRMLLESDNAAHCVEHTCVLPDCVGGKDQLRVANSNPELCNRHSQELCGKVGCHKRRTETGCYCPAHDCHITGCTAARVSGNRPLCSGHNICENEGCENEKVKIGDRFQGLCQDHLECASDLCRRKSVLGSPFCEFHSCKYQNCRAKARVDIGKPLCRNHKCEATDCRSQKAPIEANPDGDSDLELHKFCYQHKCAEDGCVGESSPVKGYCQGHCCVEKDCKNKGEIQHRCITHHEKKIADDAEKRGEERGEKRAEKRIRAEMEKQAEEKRRQQEREKENTTPPRSSGTSNIDEPSQRRYNRREDSPWGGSDYFGEPSTRYTCGRNKYWNEGRNGH